MRGRVRYCNKTSEIIGCGSELKNSLGLKEGLNDGGKGDLCTKVSIEEKEGQKEGLSLTQHDPEKEETIMNEQ